MTSRTWWVSALVAIAGSNGTGPAGASLTVNNQTANATLSLNVGSNPTVVIAADLAGSVALAEGPGGNC